MRRLVSVAKAGNWPDSDDVDSVTLGFDDRHRRRLRLTTEAGESVLLDLTKPQPLDDGDGLAIENGEGWIKIKAAPEDVMEVEGRGHADTIRLAWNLGSRHLPIQILDGDALRLRYDHVIEEMLTSLGIDVSRKKAPFVPENGAFNRRRRS
ncbi:MAG: urease accessory protein UreE [Geminicoccaceae bacterium]